MPPYAITKTISDYVHDANDGSAIDEGKKLKGKERKGNYFETQLIWPNIIGIAILHVIAIYTYIIFPYIQKIKLFLFLFAYGTVSGFGVTAGAHRLWTHKSYKAKLPLRIFLMLCYSMAGQNSLYQWVRDHRVHHKFSETSADPHDSNRGFFFSHVGWLMMRKHPDVLEKGKVVDMSDLLADPVVQFHEKYFSVLKIILAFVVPILIPYYFLNEPLLWCLGSNCSRYATSLNFTWLVNSAAHIYGYRPYNLSIKPKENKLVAFLALGEGWHNYHHTFPWDYRTGEMGHWNVTAFWIKVFSYLGLAYDLKEPSTELIESVVLKRGDHTQARFKEITDKTPN